jgi:hypothetical protein
MTTNQPPTPDPPEPLSPIAYFARAYEVHEARHVERTETKRHLSRDLVENSTGLADDLARKAKRYEALPAVALEFRVVRAQVLAIASGASTLRAVLDMEEREELTALVFRKKPRKAARIDGPEVA